MSWLSRFIGGSKSTDAVEVTEYKEFSIKPTPQREGSVYRICAQIEKDVAGTLKSHTLIRADTVNDLETATMVSINKSKQLIDELGDGLFR